MARFTVIVERDEDGILVAHVPSLRGCHTFADNWDELQERVREVMELCLEDADADTAATGDGDLVGAFQLEVAYAPHADLAA